MEWVLINQDECPGCQRRGDGGERKDGKCWRCNLPERLDKDEHAGLLRTLEIERDGLLGVQIDMRRMSAHRFREVYDGSPEYVGPILDRLLARNKQDLADIGWGDDEDAAPTASAE